MKVLLHIRRCFSMASVTLSRTKQQMPLVGFGLWKVAKSTCPNTVYEAIKAGYRLLDGAGDYGNEKEAGEGLKRAISEGLVKREDIFITSKLWNTFHAREHAKLICKKQLADWGLDYFDLFLIHFPIALEYVDPSHRYPPEWFGDDKKVHLQTIPMQETWQAMEELADAGLTKNIGLSNVQGSILLDVLRYSRIPPSVLQVELHPYLSQEPLVKLCKTLGIAMTAYSSFGPQSYIELDMDNGAQSLLKHDKVSEIAKAHNRDPAHVLLRWATQREIAVIPKSNDLNRLKSNLDCSSFNLSKEDMKELNSLNINLRLNNPVDIDPRMGIFC